MLTRTGNVGDGNPGLGSDRSTTREKAIACRLGCSSWRLGESRGHTSGRRERLDRIRFGGSSVSERELELWGSTRRQDGWGMRVELQVRQDANDHTDLGDQCDQTSLLATHATTQDVEPEDAPHELGPEVAVGRAPGGCGGACRARLTSGLRAVRSGNDVVTPGRSGGQHAVIGLPSARAEGARGRRDARERPRARTPRG